MPKRVTVTDESDTGRNLKFHDNFLGTTITRAVFVGKINQGSYENFHVRVINGVPTPVSNPDSKESNNLD